jgi:regulator of replication initiation timing
MAKLTVSELQEKLDQAKSIISKQYDEITRINKELEDTRKGLNVVSRAEFDGVIAELERVREMYSSLEKMHEKEKARKHPNKTLENDNWVLRCENEQLKRRVGELEQQGRAAIKTEPINARGAGRKEYQDIAVIHSVFSMYMQGQSLQGIADTLNQQGIPTKAGGTWAKSSVRFILLNESYVKKGIVDELEFRSVAAQMKGSVRKKPY